MSDEAPSTGGLVNVEKPSFVGWLETFLPFKLPRLPLPQTAKNLDKAAARLIMARANASIAGIENDQIVASARSRAVVTVIEAGAKAAARHIRAGDTALRQRAIEAALEQLTIEQANKEKIVELAAECLVSDPPKVDAKLEIEDDWLHDFASKASKVSRQDMQTIWAKVLAGEIQRPGTFSLRTLHQLSLMDAGDAELIHGSLDLVINGNCIYFGEKRNFCSDDHLVLLEDMGIVVGANLGLGLTLEIPANSGTALLLATSHVMIVSSANERQLNLHSVRPLTTFGRQISTIAALKSFRTGLDTAIARQLKSDGVTFKLHKLAALDSDGTYEVELPGQEISV